MALGKSQPSRFGYPHLTTFSDQAPELCGTSANMAQELKTILINGEDWEDHMLAAAGMSTTLTAQGMITQFYVKKDSKYLSSPPPL